MSKLTFDNLLKPIRRRDSKINRANLKEQFFSDRSRIVFASSFRRLMQKAQVFSLEPNSSVRNRLSHSLEVADIGRHIALIIANKLIEKGMLSQENVIPFYTIVENACLIHDIGNPPFGHFGEEAIKTWFKKNGEGIYSKLGLKPQSKESYLSDFLEFDGNPQGLRIVTTLHCETDEYGLNLTLPTLLSTLKYTRASGEKQEGQLHNKKAGFFQTEKNIIFDLWNKISWPQGNRFPFVYLMEAADDICYCLSDIADALQKKIIDSRHFKIHFNPILKEYPGCELPKETINYFAMDVSVPWSRQIIQEVTDLFINNVEAYYHGTAPELVKETKTGKLFDELKKYTRKYVYNAPEAQNIELSGHSVVWGILNHFSPLLEMKKQDFETFVNNERTGFDLEWRLFNLLPKRALKIYKFQTKKNTPDVDEWLNRAHLIVDYISAMTDYYALETYQMLEGIRIKI